LPHDGAITRTSYLRHATLTQIYVNGPQVGGLTQLWSLATEVAFYLLLPLLAKLLTGYERPTRRAVRWRLALLGGLALLGPLWMAGTTATEHALAGLWLPGYLGWFAVGMGFALWQVARSSGRLKPSVVDKLASAPGTLWGIAIALLVIASSPVAGPYSLTAPSVGQAATKSLLYTAIGACVLFPAISPTPQVEAVLGRRVGHIAGDISYGVFAYHLVVLGVVERITGHEVFKGGFAVLFWPTLVVSTALAAAGYYGMERPIMRWGRHDHRYDVSPSPVGRDSTASPQPSSTKA
jgi:peptidoglycan/LPS O-acetylase OafA/YrhL